MGNFFTSPKEEASQTLYESAMSGSPVGSSLLKNAYNANISNIRGQTSDAITQLSGDVMAQNAAAGISSTASNAQISRGTQKILSAQGQAITSASSQYEAALSDMIQRQLLTGINGLSSSSTFGDLMSGLTLLANIGAGIAGIPGVIGSSTTPSNVDEFGTDWGATPNPPKRGSL